MDGDDDREGAVALIRQVNIQFLRRGSGGIGQVEEFPLDVRRIGRRGSAFGTA